MTMFLVRALILAIAQLLCLSAFCQVPFPTVRVGIVDTGFDVDYIKEKGQLVEVEDERIAPLFDNSHLSDYVILPADIHMLLDYRELRGKCYQGRLDPIERARYLSYLENKKLLKLNKQFKKALHGTTVASIILGNEDFLILPVKAIGHDISDVILESYVTLVNEQILKAISFIEFYSQEEFRNKIIERMTSIMRKFEFLVNLMFNHQIRVVNLSYGVTEKYIRSLIESDYESFYERKIAQDDLDLMIKEFYFRLFYHSAKLIEKFPHILFIASAGNLASNNDQYAHYPSGISPRIKSENFIAVTASHRGQLAGFANFGRKTVDVAIEGVIAQSPLPMKFLSVEQAGQQQAMSYSNYSTGTSFSAASMSHLAAKIMKVNPLLTPQDVRSIILGTAVPMDSLESYVVGGRLVHNERALYAAQLSLDVPSNLGIHRSLSTIKQSLKKHKNLFTLSPQTVRWNWPNILFSGLHTNKKVCDPI